MFGTVAMTASACGPVYVQTDDDGYYRTRNRRRAVRAVPTTTDCRVGPAAFQTLASWGNWRYSNLHGCVWTPNAIRDPMWRPYWVGSWSYTKWGWTWDSAEPWGWATYHYGRWFWDGRFGWSWVPGYDWAPAWVLWRNGGGCVGWAPMGPRGANHAHPTYWTFVEHRNFRSRRVRTVVITKNRTTTVYNQSVIIANTGRLSRSGGGQVSYNRGPKSTRVGTWTRTRIAPRPIASIPSARPRALPKPPARPAPRATRPAARPAPNYRSAPGTRPAPAARPGPTYTRPAPTTRPAPARPAAGRPAARPPTPRPYDTGSRPRPGTTDRPGPGVSPAPARPTPTRVYPATPTRRPAPAARPSRPAQPRHQTRPAPPRTRPAPTTRPAARPTRPAARPTRPTARPTRPTTRPTRPTTRPTRPTARPTRPTTRPTRPSARPTRPSARPAPPAPGRRPPSADVRVAPNKVKPRKNNTKKRKPWDTRELKDPRPREVPRPVPPRGTR